MRRRVGSLVGRTMSIWPRQCCTRARSLGTIHLLVVIALVTLSIRGPFSTVSAAHPAQSTHLAVPDSLSLAPSLPSPQPVGTPITWTAAAATTLASTITSPVVYQFSVGSSPTGPFTVRRAFSTHNSFVWAPLDEGLYYIQVTAKQGFTSTASTTTMAPFALSSRVSGGRPVVSRTANALVALYSAPACSGGRMHVAFQQVGSATWQQTNSEPCQAGQSRNFLVAGMLQNTPYLLVNVVAGTTTITSSALSFTTGSIPSNLVLPSFTVPVPPGPQTDTAQGLVMHIMLDSLTINYPAPIATDLQGRVVWYANERDLVERVWPVRYQPVAGSLGSTVFLLGNDGLQSKGEDVLREIDLAGTPVQETNVQAINAQLLARGDELIYGFHHDATFLPNGDIAVLGQTQQVITTTPVMGDMLVVLDPTSLRVVWTWDAFHFLNPYRGPTLGETCRTDPKNYCAVPGGPSTIDWLHTNTIAWSPADHNIVLSMRHQDWLVKINYANGSGDGSVLWRMGRDGDFTIVPLSKTDPYPWFSHQHDLNYIDDTTIELFDNGNVRYRVFLCLIQGTAMCDSRGQVYRIDEQKRIATQLLNADLHTYSDAFGTAQLLDNGNFSFTAGIIAIPYPPYTQDIEVIPGGGKAYEQQINSTEYRAWRLTTLYSPTG